MLTTTSEFHLACQQLKPIVDAAAASSAAMAASMLEYHKRFETIFLMPRSGGKTEIGRHSKFGFDGMLSPAGGWLDEQRDCDLPTLARHIGGMMKLKREQRSAFPDYNPKIFLRPETWDIIKGRLHHVQPHEIASTEFPKEVFYRALAAGGATPDALAQFDQTWLKNCYDAAGRLLPGLAFSALKHTIEESEKTDSMALAKWRGYATASSQLVSAQTDILHWFYAMAPVDKNVYMSGHLLTVPYDRMLLRVRQGQRTRKLPYDLTASGFIRFCEVAGMWKRHKGYVKWARPYAVGTTYLKACLTEAALQRMLDPL